MLTRLSARRFDLLGLRCNVIRQYFWVAVWPWYHRLASVARGVFGLPTRYTFSRKARTLFDN